MKANEYSLVQMAVEEGIAFGLSRADKYADDPLTEAQRERVSLAVDTAVMAAICEWFTFQDFDAT